MLNAAFRPGNWGGFGLLVSCFLQARGAGAVPGAGAEDTPWLSFPPSKINIELFVRLIISSLTGISGTWSKA